MTRDSTIVLPEENGNLQRADHISESTSPRGAADDRGVTFAQCKSESCLHNGEGVRLDFESASHYFKLAADQGFAVPQNNYGLCLKEGEGVRIDFKGAAHYFKLATDQGVAVAQNNYGLCLKKGEGVSIAFDE
jgi:TPR repeat protein